MSSVDVGEALVAARRDMQYMIEVQDAETKRLLIYAGVAVLLVGVVLAGAAIAAGGTAVAAGAAATAGGEAVVGGLAAAELASVSTQVISLAVVRAASGIALETVVQATPRIAASVTIYLAGRQFTAPPETVGICIEGGCEVGEASTPALPLR